MPGAVDQNLHRSDPLSDHGTKGSDLFSVRNIAMQCQRLAAGTLEPLRQCLKLFLIARGNYNNAPPRANSTAIASPIPPLAPVTSTTLSRSPVTPKR